jgi:hypothetical protein
MWRAKRLLDIVSSGRASKDLFGRTVEVREQRSTVMSVLTAVTDAEAKVVDTVKSVKKPVVGYMSKGVEFTEGWLPQVSYPKTLPEPVEVLDSQYKFVTALLAAEHDLVKAMVQTLAPLVGAGAKSKTKSTKATKATKAAA